MAGVTSSVVVGRKKNGIVDEVSLVGVKKNNGATSDVAGETSSKVVGRKKNGKVDEEYLVGVMKAIGVGSDVGSIIMLVVDWIRAYRPSTTVPIMLVEKIVVVPSNTVLPRIVDSRPVDLVLVASTGLATFRSSGSVGSSSGTPASDVASITATVGVEETTLVIVSRRLLTMVLSPT